MESLVGILNDTGLLEGNSLMFFSAGTEIETGSRAGVLSTETKGTWTSWPETRNMLM